MPFKRFAILASLVILAGLGALAVLPPAPDPEPPLDLELGLAADLAGVAAAQRQQKKRYGRFAKRIVPPGLPATPEQISFRGVPGATYLVVADSSTFIAYVIHPEFPGHCAVAGDTGSAGALPDVQCFRRDQTDGDPLASGSALAAGSEGPTVTR